MAETATAPSSKTTYGARLGYMAERQPRCLQRRESLGQDQRRSTSTSDICNPQAVRESSLADATCTTPVRRDSQSPSSGIGGRDSSSSRPSSVTCPGEASAGDPSSLEEDDSLDELDDAEDDSLRAASSAAGSQTCASRLRQGTHKRTAQLGHSLQQGNPA